MNTVGVSAVNELALNPMKHRFALLLAAFIGLCGLAPEKANAFEVYVNVHHHHHGRYWVRGHWSRHHHYWIPGHWVYYH